MITAFVFRAVFRTKSVRALSKKAAYISKDLPVAGQLDQARASSSVGGMWGGDQLIRGGILSILDRGLLGASWHCNCSEYWASPPLRRTVVSAQWSQPSQLFFPPSFSLEIRISPQANRAAKLAQKIFYRSRRSTRYPPPRPRPRKKRPII